MWVFACLTLQYAWKNIGNVGEKIIGEKLGEKILIISSGQIQKGFLASKVLISALDTLLTSVYANQFCLD